MHERSTLKVLHDTLQEAQLPPQDLVWSNQFPLPQFRDEDLGDVRCIYENRGREEKRRERRKRDARGEARGEGRDSKRVRESFNLIIDIHHLLDKECIMVIIHPSMLLFHIAF